MSRHDGKGAWQYLLRLTELEVVDADSYETARRVLKKTLGRFVARMGDILAPYHQPDREDYRIRANRQAD